MSYYEKRIADLEARVAQLSREQRLKAIPVEAKLLERYALMQAENTRLRKAGDAVSLCLEAYWKGKPYDVSMTIECFDAWNAAKEGKQS
jgi:hypothetical protein